jgi:hypothetical protein
MPVKKSVKMHAPNVNIIKRRILGYVKMKQMGLPTSVSRVAAFNLETSLLMEPFIPSEEGRKRKQT